MNLKVLCLALVSIWVSGCMSYEKRVDRSDFIGEFHDGYAVCRQAGKEFFIDSSGHRVSGKYDDASDFSHGYAVACRYSDGNRLLSFLDRECNEFHYPINGVYGDANSYGNIWVNISSGFYGGWALMNIKTGSFLTPVLSHIDCISSKGTAVVSRFVERTGSIVGYYEYALYDGQGNELAPFGKFSYIGNFQNGLALYSTTGYFHFTQSYDSDKEKKTSVDRLDGFKNLGDARVGYINELGQVCCPELFVYAGMFNEYGYAHVLFPSGMDHSYLGAHTYSYIDRKDMQALKGLELARAKASFLQDGQWAIGTDDNGVPVLVNRQGVVHSFDKDVCIAKLGDYYLARQGGEYILYISNPEEGLSRLCSITGSGDEVVTIEENRYGDCICFYSKRRLRNGYYEKREYNLDGSYMSSSSEFYPPYDYATGKIHGRLNFKAFKF